MFGLLQLRVRDLLWLMLVCALVARSISRWGFLEVDAVIHSPIYIAGSGNPPQIGSDRYYVHIRGDRGWNAIYEPDAALKAQLDRLTTATVPAHLHLASPLPPDPPGQSPP